MTRINIIDIDAIPVDVLNGFMRFAAMPDNSSADIATNALRSALQAVSEYTETALIGMRVRHEEKGHRISFITPFAGDVTEVSVGEAWCGDIVFPTTDSVMVEYRVKPLSHELDRLRMVAYRYASALYDGADSVTLNKILQEAL